MAGVALGDFGDLFRGAFGDEAAAAVAALGAHVEEPVGGLDDVEIVLDDEDRVAGVYQTIQHADQLLDVGEMEAGGRLIEDVDRAAGGALGEFGGQLYALRLAAGERGRGLAEPYVVESDVVEGLDLARDVREVREELDLPLYFTSSVSRLYRLPLHTSQGT